MELSYSVVVTELFKHIRKYNLHNATWVADAKSIANYLRKHFRRNEFYQQLDENERKKCEKEISSIVFDYASNENESVFSISKLHEFLKKVCYDRS